MNPLPPLRRIAVWLSLALIAIAAIAPARAAINVDGILDEPEWAEAKVFRDFVVTEPLTRAQPKYQTELRVLARPEALYVAMRVEHPRAERTHGRGPRDSPNMPADPAILLIDFEGQGNTAYEFTVSLSGTMRDGIVLKQTQISLDWDAAWIARVHEDDAGWAVEWSIPWSVAPEGLVHGDQRTIGVYAARYIKKESVRYAYPAIELLGSNFVHEFQKIEIPRYRAASLDWFPYASVGRDNLSHSGQLREGIDVVWRPNGQNQLSAAVRPDFGQVESDNLVVNFSAIATFFDEKRPFFTEGQQLFDLRTTDNGRLVNTRRIGAAPDTGSAGGTDVLLAGKYSGTAGANEYGVFAALEDNSDDARGRRYGVGRYHFKLQNSSIGWLGSYVQRPTLARDAIVQSLDYDWVVRPGIALSSQLIESDIRQSPNAANENTRLDQRGHGAWLTLSYQPGGRWQHTLSVTHFDRHLDFNDMGYQQRADINELNIDSLFFTRQYSKRSWADSGDWHLNVNLSRNTSGEAQQGAAELGHFWTWRNGDSTYAWYFHETTGLDDLISRGNGSVRIPQRHNWGVNYQTAQSGRVRWQAVLRLHEQGISGYTRDIELAPTWFLTESLSAGIDMTFVHSDEWLLWLSANRFGRYRRNEVDSYLNINWFPRPRHELRFKMQWVGLGARVKGSYQLNAQHQLVALPGVSPDGGKDFTFSHLGLQLRYRYELQPLSDLYIVYSRGGDGSLADQSEGLWRQLDRAWSTRTADQLFVKLRYRFN